MKFRDYYKILGVNKNSTAEETKKAFRKLARKYHPDVNSGDKSAEKKFKEVNEAYEVLSDPGKRQKYDELGSNWKYYQKERADPFGANVPPGFREGSGRSGFRTASDEEIRSMFGENPFSDFFHTFFDGQKFSAQRRAPRRTKGRDIEHRLEISLSQAFHGLTQRLSLSSGKRIHSVEVRIPPGVTHGSRIRVAGEGESILGGKQGDLYLRIALKSHPDFERKKRDLHVKIATSVTTAVLGGDVEVPTIDGTSIRLKIPESTQQGQVFRLKGKGMPTLNGKSRGDLYVTLKIYLPSKLSADAKRHYKALAEIERRNETEAKNEDLGKAK